MKNTTVQVEMKPTKKNHYKLSINGIEIGEFERSEYRSIIQQIDNKI